MNKTVIHMFAACLLLIGGCNKQPDVLISSIVSSTYYYDEGEFHPMDEAVTLHYIYNGNDMIDSILVMTKDSTIISKQVLGYDEENRLISEEYYDNDELNCIFSYSYEGICMTEIQTDATFKVIAHNEVETNRNGDPVHSVQTFPSTGTVKTTDYKYWPNGKLRSVSTLSTYTEVETLKDIEYSKFDRQGNQTSYHQEHYAANGQDNTDEEIKYLFDKHGNWIEKTVFLKGDKHPQGKYVREITYR